MIKHVNYKRDLNTPELTTWQSLLWCYSFRIQYQNTKQFMGKCESWKIKCNTSIRFFYEISMNTTNTTISIHEWTCHKISKSDYLINTRIFEQPLCFVFDFIYAKIGLSLNERVFHIFELVFWSCSVCLCGNKRESLNGKRWKIDSCIFSMPLYTSFTAKSWNICIQSPYSRTKIAVVMVPRMISLQFNQLRWCNIAYLRSEQILNEFVNQW